MILLFCFLTGLIVGSVGLYWALEKYRARLADQQIKQNVKEHWIREATKKVEEAQLRIAQEEARLQQAMNEFRNGPIALQQYRDENILLKRDLQNIAITLNKSQLDDQVRHRNQVALEQKVDEIGQRYLDDNVKWISKSLTSDNFTNAKQRLQDIIKRCLDIGLHVSAEMQRTLIDNLKAEYKRVVSIALEREQQAKIKAQIREEQARQREIDREINQLEREREAIQAALDKALKEAHDQHSEEIERLRIRLAEAEERAKRATSMAQLTKSGNVYVISNIGSFGEGVFKIGMTRRLTPQDRVDELGDASVPFPFDVHMMLASDDAPSLENALHRALHASRVNKTNPRKEFFRADIHQIANIVKEHHGDVAYVADAEALQYRQSITMSTEDQDYIDDIFDMTDPDLRLTGDEV